MNERWNFQLQVLSGTINIHLMIQWKVGEWQSYHCNWSEIVFHMVMEELVMFFFLTLWGDSQTWRSLIMLAIFSGQFFVDFIYSLWLLSQCFLFLCAASYVRFFTARTVPWYICSLPHHTPLGCCSNPFHYSLGLYTSGGLADCPKTQLPLAVTEMTWIVQWHECGCLNYCINYWSNIRRCFT